MKIQVNTRWTLLVTVLLVGFHARVAFAQG